MSFSSAPNPRSASWFVTALIRSMTGRYCFHRCLSINISGGYPIPGLGWRGTPYQVWGGGYPRQVLMMEGGTKGTPQLGLDGGGYPAQVWGGVGTPARSKWWGVPHPGQYPSQVLMMGSTQGTPPARSGWGYPGYPYIKTSLEYPL